MKVRRLLVLALALIGASLLVSGCGLIDIILADPFSRLGEACDLSPIEVNITEPLTEGACSADECSIHQAVAASNFCPGEQTILIPDGTYRVESNIDIQDGVDIRGEGSDSTILSIKECWEISSSGVHISGLQFRDKNADDSDLHDTGCALAVMEGASLELHDSWIREGWRSSTGYRFLGSYTTSAAIMNLGQLRVVNSIIERGKGDSTDWNDGIIGIGDGIEVAETEFRNSGLTSDSDLEIRSSWFNSSQLSYWGCDIETSIIEGTTFSDTVNALTLIWGTPITVRNSTISGNDNGLNVLSLYTCPRIIDEGTRLEYVTVTENNTGLDFDESVTLRGSIIAGNAERDCRMDGPGRGTSEGYNLDSDGSCGFEAGIDITEADPLLGPLQDNGGPTLTHALMDGSLAIDAAGPDCVATDQRGVARPVGGGCDSGAYESAFAVIGTEPTATTLPEIEINFNADRYTIERNECTTLRWAVTGADTITLLGAEREATEAQEVCPDETTGYTLIAENAADQVQSFLEIEVTEPSINGGPAIGCTGFDDNGQLVCKSSCGPQDPAEPCELE